MDAKTLSDQLRLLVQAGLLNLQRSNPDLEYSFNSAMVYETAYNSLVRQDRRKLHLAVGEALEDQYSDHVNELAPLLAEHFHHAGDDERALLYFMLAGNQALGRYANAEAARHFTTSLALANRIFRKDADASPEAIISELYRKRGQALWWGGYFTQALENYREMGRVAEERGDRAMELACLTDLSNLYSAPNPQFDSAKGEALALQAKQLAQQLGNKQAEAHILWILLMNSFFSNQTDKARAYGEQSLTLAEESGQIDQMALTLNDLARFVYTPQLQFDQALASAGQAQEIWRQLDHKPRLGDSLLTEAIVRINLGEFDKALDLTGQAIAIGESVGSLWTQAFGKVIEGDVFLERGEYDLALASLDRGYQLSELSGFMPGLTIAFGLESTLYGRMGALPQALAYANYAVKTAESQAPFWLTQALGSLALLQVEMGELDQAEETIRRAHRDTPEHFLGFYTNYIPMAECELNLKRAEYTKVLTEVGKILDTLYEQKAIGLLPYFLYYKGKALQGLGQLDAAREALSEGCRTADASGARFPWWRCLASLAELNDQLGRPAQAKSNRQAARQIVDFICQHAGTPDLRLQFELHEEIRKIYSE